MSPRPRTLGIVAAVVAALALLVGVATHRSTLPTGDVPSRGEVHDHAKTGDPHRLLPGQLGRPLDPDREAALPPSLRDTEIDGWLGVDDDGHSVVTPGAKLFFDYFLSATGEETTDVIRSRIVSEIERRLPPMGAGEAIALLDRYLDYRERVRALPHTDPGSDLRARLDGLHRMRVDVFGQSDAAILFGAEEQVQAADLERRAILSDTTLAADERERRLHEVEQHLPPAARAARDEAMAVVRLRQDEQALLDAGGSPADIQALREQRFGGEAAARLVALDRERAAWEQRFDDYRRARKGIEESTTLDADARARAVDALLAQRFTPQERLRVDALDQGSGTRQ